MGRRACLKIAPGKDSRETHVSLLSSCLSSAAADIIISHPTSSCLSELGGAAESHHRWNWYEGAESCLRKWPPVRHPELGLGNLSVAPSLRVAGTTQRSGSGRCGKGLEWQFNFTIPSESHS